MNVTTKMYTKLFNEFTNIQEELQNIIERMKSIQIETEAMYTYSKDE